MPNIFRNFQKQTYYHVFNRGFNRQTLFLIDKDYQRFLEKMKYYQAKYPSIEILAFCLLPNHFHLVLRDRVIDDPKVDLDPNIISHFMKGLQLSHAMYFSLKYKDIVKKGLKMPVYEGRFCAKLINEVNYLEQVVAYVDNNAFKHGLVSDPIEWSYTSLHTRNERNVFANLTDEELQELEVDLEIFLE